MQAGALLDLVVESPEGDLLGQTIDVYVSELGFDGWSVRRHIGAWVVDGPATTLRIDPMSLPLRPVGSVAEVRFEAQYTPVRDEGDPEEPKVVRIPSAAISVAYAPDETEVYVAPASRVLTVEVAAQIAATNGHAAPGDVTDLVTAAVAAPGTARKKALSLVERSLGDLRGTIMAEDGTSYPIEAAPREGIPGSPESRGELGAGSPLATVPGSWITPKTVYPAEPPRPGVPTKLAFFSWSTMSFRDSDLGETTLPGPNSSAIFPSRGRAPMSYAEVTGFALRSDGRIDFANGYTYHLNSAGFFVEEVRPSRMVLSFRHQDIYDATRRVTIVGLDAGGPASGDDALVDLQRIDLGDTRPVHVTMVRESVATRAAAVTSSLLVTQGLQVPATFTIRAGEGCGGPGLDAIDPATGAAVPAEACVSQGTVYLGRNVTRDANGQRILGPGDTSEEKFVVAHELGHALEYQTLGSTPGGVAYDDSLWDGDLCACRHVAGANSLHCLQSKMSMAGGYQEGFAHFVATAVMNTNNHKAATFAYYKEVLKPHWNPMVSTPPKKVQPPFRVDAGKPVAWQRNRCDSGVQANRSTEYDWMTFLWGIHQRETAGSIDYATWMGIARDGWCGGGTCSGRGTLTWEAVRANALSKFGNNFNDPRMLRMNQVGFDSAVTN